jgi:Protein of unknown function (DUF475)
LLPPLSLFFYLFFLYNSWSFDLIEAVRGLVSDPWEHVIGMGIGAVFVNSLVKWDEQLKQDLDKMLDKAKAANERRYFGKIFPYFFSFALMLSLFC